MRTAFLTCIFFILPLLMAEGGAEAQNRRVQRADKAFELRQYHDAINHYRRAFSRVNRRDRREGTRIVFQTALCYRYTDNHRMAEAWFRRAVRLNYPDSIAVLYLADALMQNEKFEEAREQYARYAELVPDDWRGLHGKRSVELAMDQLANPTAYEVEQIQNFISRADDYTAAFGDHRATSLIFASSREDALGRDPDPWTGNKHTSFFVSFQDRSGNWGRPSLLDEGPINTEYNEGAPSVNASATRLYFTRCVRSTDAEMGCRIMEANREGASWGSPREVPLTTDSAVTVGHPAISPDGLDLYFSSDMPGGVGSMDIWVVRRRSEGDAFGPPENLGPVINTKGNEMFPYIREDGSLYFASDGHHGMGGLDLFRSLPTPEGWSEPENLGVPINSPGDDFGIVFKPGEEKGFFSSNRSGSRGGYSLYSFYLAPVLFTIEGMVTDASTGQFLPGASVQLVGSDGSLQVRETNVQGRYRFDQGVVREHTSYELLVSKEKYFSLRESVSTVGLEASQDFVLDFALELIPETPIELPEILYEFARWELQPQFKDSLNGLVRTMEDNPTIVIELASHTDTRGGYEYNDTLSQRRAQTVVDYLIAQGIDPARMEAVGYGKRSPREISQDMEREGFFFEAGTVLTESFINSLPDEEHREVAHQLNRRTEFRVIRDDFDPRAGESQGDDPPGMRAPPQDQQPGR